MQKKILVLAVAATLSAPAFADVSVYGKADLAVGSVSNGTARNTVVSSQVSKIGFKGSEDLDGGLSAIWQIEQQIDMDSGAGKVSFASRNTFLGLKSDSAGTIMLGKHDTPYKESTRHLDVFGDQFADSRHLMGGGNKANAGSYMDMRPGNEIMYVTPTFAGVKVSASYVGSENATTSTAVKSSLVSLAGVYNQGPIYAAVAYQKVNYGTVGDFVAAAPLGNNDTLKATKAGVGYTMDAFKVTAVVEKITSSGATVLNTLSRTDVNLNGMYKFGDNDVKLAVTKAGNSGGVAATGAKMIAVGFDHNLSKATSVYVQAAKISNDKNANFQFNGAATTATTAGGVNGSSPSGILLGIKHAF